jgi:hypothetical protein
VKAGEGENIAFSDNRLSPKEAVGKILLYGLLACFRFGSSKAGRTSTLIWLMVFRLLFSNSAVIIYENERAIVVRIYIAGSTCVSGTKVALQW